MLDNPKVTFIVPIYNTEKYLKQCLDSILSQTLKEIEVICIDDASTDDSAVIIRKYSENDDRVKCVFLKESRSALVARKIGVELAKGEYILFVDSDDYIEKNTCNDLYNKISELKVEILQFNSIIENCANASESRIRANEKMIEPYCNYLYDDDIFNYCFKKKKYSITLWNKIFSTKLCKKAFSYISEEYLPKAQDVYTYFIISFFAKSYFGWNSKKYYHYCFGRGTTGASIITLDIFRRYCLQANVVSELKKFALKMNISNDANEIIEKFFKQWINECILLWFDKISENDQEEANKILFTYWKKREILNILSQKYYYQRAQIAEKIINSKSCDLVKNKENKNIAIYYYRYTIGGIQRVISELIKLYKNMGFNVILITDEKNGRNEFFIDDDVNWVTIKNWKTVNKNNIQERNINWIQIIKKYDIDMVIYHAWTSPLLLWDILSLKFNNVKVVVQTHSIFSYSLISFNKDFSILPRVLKLADGIVTLSKVDWLFWKCFNSNVCYIQNPIDKKLLNANRSNGINKSIVWVGRFSNEKQPWEAIKIMELVVKVIPDAVLYMIGDGDNNILEKYKKNIINKKLENNIKLMGFQNNVYSFYEKSSIYLLTSIYEGFPMTILEAKAHGLAIVMYKMPYLENTTKDDGVISVANYTQAANKIINLLNDKNEWKFYSSKSWENFRIISNYDYVEAWEKVLSLNFITDNIKDFVNDKNYSRLMNTIVEHYRLGWEKNNVNINNLRKLISNGNENIDILVENTKKSKLLVFYCNVYRMFFTVYDYYRKNGISATIKKCKEKLVES